MRGCLWRIPVERKTPGECDARKWDWRVRGRGMRHSSAAPISALGDCLKAFEHFLNDVPEPYRPPSRQLWRMCSSGQSILFLDGNGRLGRLLIMLQLVADGVFACPMLYPGL